MDKRQTKRLKVSPPQIEESNKALDSEEESDDDDFITAVDKFERKGSQKDLERIADGDEYTTSGIRIEPFSMRNEMRAGIVNKDGVY